MKQDIAFNFKKINLGIIFIEKYVRKNIIFFSYLIWYILISLRGIVFLLLHRTSKSFDNITLKKKGNQIK